MYGAHIGAHKIPGLDAEITLTNEADVVFETSGGIANGGALSGDFVKVNIRLVVNGAVLLDRDYDVENGQYSRGTNWSLSVAKTLPAGIHNVFVQATSKQGNAVGLPAVIAGDSNSPARGTLTVAVLNK